MNRIALLIPTLDQIGGAERQLISLAKSLSQRGWQVTVIVLSGQAGSSRPAETESASNPNKQDAIIELTQAGVSTLSLGMRKAWIDPRGWLRYIRWARQAKPHIVHAHLPHASWFARWVRLLAPARVVIDTIHTTSAGGAGRRFAYRLSSPLSTHITCVSEAVASAVVASGMSSRKKLNVVVNGVDLRPITDPCAQLQNRRISAFQWIAVGRLAPVKDYPTLIRAMAKLESPASLLILGTGPGEQSLRQLAVDLDISDRIEFAGFHADIEPYLRTADALVLSSLWEGLPMTLLEAAAAGLPVVATDGPGTREAMVPDQTGYLVPIGDAAALATAMNRLMALPAEQRHQMGAFGRRFVRQNFDLEMIVDRWEMLYLELLQQNPKAKRSG